MTLFLDADLEVTKAFLGESAAALGSRAGTAAGRGLHTSRWGQGLLSVTCGGSFPVPELSRSGRAGRTFCLSLRRPPGVPWAEVLSSLLPQTRELRFGDIECCRAEGRQQEPGLQDDISVA